MAFRVVTGTEMHGAFFSASHGKLFESGACNVNTTTIGSDDSILKYGSAFSTDRHGVCFRIFRTLNCQRIVYIVIIQQNLISLRHFQRRIVAAGYNDQTAATFDVHIRFHSDCFCIDLPDRVSGDSLFRTEIDRKRGCSTVEQQLIDAGIDLLIAFGGHRRAAFLVGGEVAADLIIGHCALGRAHGAVAQQGKVGIHQRGDVGDVIAFLSDVDVAIALCEGQRLINVDAAGVDGEALRHEGDGAVLIDPGGHILGRTVGMVVAGLLLFLAEEFRHLHITFGAVDVVFAALAVEDLFHLVAIRAVKVAAALLPTADELLFLLIAGIAVGVTRSFFRFANQRAVCVIAAFAVGVGGAHFLPAHQHIHHAVTALVGQVLHAHVPVHILTGEGKGRVDGDLYRQVGAQIPIPRKEGDIIGEDGLFVLFKGDLIGNVTHACGDGSIFRQRTGDGQAAAPALDGGADGDIGFAGFLFHGRVALRRVSMLLCGAEQLILHQIAAFAVAVVGALQHGLEGIAVFAVSMAVGFSFAAGEGAVLAEAAVAVGVARGFSFAAGQTQLLAKAAVSVVMNVAFLAAADGVAGAQEAGFFMDMVRADESFLQLTALGAVGMACGFLAAAGKIADGLEAAVAVGVGFPLFEIAGAHHSGVAVFPVVVGGMLFLTADERYLHVTFGIMRMRCLVVGYSALGRCFLYPLIAGFHMGMAVALRCLAGEDTLFPAAAFAVGVTRALGEGAHQLLTGGVAVFAVGMGGALCQRADHHFFIEIAGAHVLGMQRIFRQVTKLGDLLGKADLLMAVPGAVPHGAEGIAILSVGVGIPLALGAGEDTVLPEAAVAVGMTCALFHAAGEDLLFVAALGSMGVVQVFLFRAQQRAVLQIALLSMGMGGNAADGALVRRFCRMDAGQHGDTLSQQRSGQRQRQNTV